MSENVLTPNDIAWARDHLRGMVNEVRIECSLLRTLPPGIVTILDILGSVDSLTVVEGPETTPENGYFTISSSHSGRIIYQAIPLQHQFRPLIETLRAFSTGESPRSESDHATMIAAIAPVTIDVLISSHCPHCGEVVAMVNQFAALSTRVGVTITDVQLFPEMAEKWSVQAVPAIVIDGHLAFLKDIERKTVVEYVTGSPLARRRRELISLLGDRRIGDAVSLVLEENDGKTALAELAASPLLSMRIGALTLLEELVEASHSVAADFLPLLLDRLGTEDNAVCCDIIMALSIIGDSRAVPELERLLLSGNEDIRDSARDALDTISPR